ncbi:CDP-diacylglycerol--glycerol-3-phosphate 3-phosphatidyltransferase [Tissierella creatinophila]|uniref:CDP-diacylglycerol--glycerol-3-phosphate 3-phosphatidyltransferase n=1 Tax=Tissierella creatinophila DSM 6911 TaxID=1123403 RepID=A0A1U7M588_TISCR|nr:CDP-diacylglycerol--glycerol-3-phosphate 3-phosphatidyltransferase [Tissierella creatinophila]OLS02445.1 CDP-diacylglycerol--glycerol-3-phosphate 3-phosphatidyltransferase [Tissierella creatinophila DSM 6911]
MNIPNLLTILRIFLVPIYLLIFFSDLENRFFLAGLVFILAGISDVLDGSIARKYNLITKLGIVLDPIADKMMIFAVLISYTIEKIIPSWILIAIGVKEIVMILGGGILYLYKGKQVVPSNIYGKTATVSFYAATLSIVFKISTKLSEVLFIITVILNILAFINYLKIYISKRNNIEEIS